MQIDIKLKTLKFPPPQHQFICENPLLNLEKSLKNFRKLFLIPVKKNKNKIQILAPIQTKIQKFLTN